MKEERRERTGTNGGEKSGKKKTRHSQGYARFQTNPVTVASWAIPCTPHWSWYHLTGLPRPPPRRPRCSIGDAG